jgi:hypothetical protein
VHESTGIDNIEGLSVPIGHPVLAVTRNATHIIDNGLSLLKQAIEQGTFSYIGSSDYCNRK